MSGMILLFIAAAALRIFGAAIRVGNYRWFIHIVGWVLCTTAVWAATGAAGAWFPLWPVLVLGGIGALADIPLKRPELWTVADIIAVIFIGLLSIPPLGLGLLAGSIIFIGGIGFIIDSLLIRLSRRVPLTVFLVPLVIVVTMGSLIVPLYLKEDFSRLWNKFPPDMLIHLGLTSVHAGNRVVLETGDIAWLRHPSGEGPFLGALLFHGAHPDGSKQPSAIVLQHALVDAGYVVLAVDHPGYGESPAPNSDTGTNGWNPLPTTQAALNYLRSASEVKDIMVLGHSMGATDALRLLSVEPDLQVGIIFGAAAGEPNESPETAAYWYERFHADRGMQDYLSQNQVLEIRKRFYDDSQYVQALKPDHPPILFGQFEREWSNIADTRDRLYDAVPGRKKIWNIAGSTHYFNSFARAGLIIGDTRITRTVASRLRLLATEFGDPGFDQSPSQTVGTW